MSISIIRSTAICLTLTGMLVGKNAYCQHLKESDYVVIPYTIQMDWIFPLGSKAATLSTAEIDTANRLLRDCLNKYNTEQQKPFQEAKKADPDVRERDYVIDVNRYKLQYVCAVCPDGDKFVWMNFLCSVDDDFLDWRKSIVQSYDGGNCFFQLKINLTKKQYSGFNVNGY